MFCVSFVSAKSVAASIVAAK